MLHRWPRYTTLRCWPWTVAVYEPWKLEIKRLDWAHSIQKIWTTYRKRVAQIDRRETDVGGFHRPYITKTGHQSDPRLFWKTALFCVRYCADVVLNQRKRNDCMLNGSLTVWEDRLARYLTDARTESTLQKNWFVEKLYKLFSDPVKNVKNIERRASLLDTGRLLGMNKLQDISERLLGVWITKTSSETS